MSYQRVATSRLYSSASYCLEPLLTPLRLVSGERHRRFEARLAARGVKIRGVSSPALPRWANAWHSGSFSKLAALGLLGYDR